MNIDSATDQNDSQPAQILQLPWPPLKLWATKYKVTGASTETGEKRTSPQPSRPEDFCCHPLQRKENPRTVCLFHVSCLCDCRHQSHFPCLAQENLFWVCFLFSGDLHLDPQDILESFEDLVTRFSQVLLGFPLVSAWQNECMIV